MMGGCGEGVSEEAERALRSTKREGQPVGTAGPRTRAPNAHPLDAQTERPGV